MKKYNYEKFIAFLKENECYDKFMENYNKNSDNNRITLKVYCSIVSPKDYIQCAFRWKDFFWCDLDAKWHNEFKK